MDTKRVVAEKVDTAIRSNERTVAWVARKTGMRDGVLRTRVNAEIAFNVEEIGNVAQALGVPVSSLLPDEWAVSQ